MNIAFIIPSLANKGPIIVVRDIILGLVSRGHKCSVFYFDDIEGLDMGCLSTKIKFSEKRDFSEFDIVHSHGLRPDIYAVLKIKNKKNIKRVTTLHSYLNDDLASHYHKLIAFVFARVWIYMASRLDKVIVLSHHAKQYYSDSISSKKIEIAYNTSILTKSEPLSEELQDQILQIKKDYKIIGINALLSPLKGVDQLIKALVDLPTCFLIVVGDGKSKVELEEFSLNLGVNARCLFLGYQPNAYRFLQYYDIYAMTSHSEGFGLVVLEAAQYKVPVVCSDLPIFRELYSAEDVAFFTLKDIQSLKNAILLLLNNSRYGEHLYKTFQSKYSFEHFTDKYIDIYEKVLNKGNNK